MSNGTIPTHVRVRETGKAGEVEELMHDGRYLVRFPEDENTPAPTYGVYDRADLMSGWTETTGEHIHHKLADDLYQDFISPRDVPPPTTPEHLMNVDYAGIEQRLLAGGSLTDAQAELLYEMATHRGPKRSRMLTPTEIIMALLIVGAIVAAFIFVVFAIKIW